MRLAFDTSVLVAGVVEAHPHHARARPWIRAVTSHEVQARISWHAAAETWSVLTRLPAGFRLAPATATLVLDRLLESFPPSEVTGGHYRAAVRRCTEKGLRSGALFDALHLVVAEGEETDAFVTFDVGDFERLSVEASPSIVLPPDPPAFVI